MRREDARWTVATLLAACLCVMTAPLALLVWLCCGRR
jgi:hypothetical protein